jgi:3-phosphoshikimate 1-carboxyvinyltransferase
MGSQPNMTAATDRSLKNSLNTVSNQQHDDSLNAIVLPPVRHAHGHMTLPGSKSISNRVLLLSALAQGATRVTGLLKSDDTNVMLKALEQLGVEVNRLSETEVLVRGMAQVGESIDHHVSFLTPRAELFLGNAGTAFRPLTAVLAVLGGDYTLSGVSRMHERPIGDLVEALRAWGAQVKYLGEPGYPPLHIGQSVLKANRVQVKGAVSSQFLTALLMVSPCVAQRTGQDVVIEVVGTLISRPYIDITINLMTRFGVGVEQVDLQTFRIAANARYVSPGELAVEGDASSASYFMALGLLGGGPVTVQGVDEHSIQGDVLFAQTLQAMGAEIYYGPLTIQTKRPTSLLKLRAFDLDFNLIPDAAMTAAVLAIYADGPCVLRNIGSWRVKETDRIHAMQTELTKIGARVESGEDWLKVWPIADEAWRSADIHTYDDHRMAMCFSLATFGPVAIRVLDPGCVAKTFPHYFDVYTQLVHA